MALLLVSSPALAAKSGGTAVATGNDISWPQCGSKLPSGQAFGIVGINDGLANTTNPCLAAELTWAGTSTGKTAQPKVQAYVNTANPGGLNTASWPSDNIDPSGFDTRTNTTNPYGVCDHSNSAACAWQYGWNRANEDITQRLASASTNPASSYIWWLDVETGNTWDTTTGGVARNDADLEGMTAYFQRASATVGLYSTTPQWQSIAGTVGSGSNLAGLINWRPGARTLSAAKSNCSLTPLTPGGKVTITQYISSQLDYDYSCI